MASLATSSYGASTAGRYCRPVFLAGQSLLTLSDTRCLNRPSCHNNKALAQRPCNGTRRPSTPAWPTTSVCLPIGTASLRQGALFFFFIYYRCSYEKELTLVSLLAGDWRSTTAGIANTQRSSPTPRQRAGLGSTWRTVFFPSTFFFFFLLKLVPFWHRPPPTWPQPFLQQHDHPQPECVAVQVRVPHDAPAQQQPGVFLFSLFGARQLVSPFIHFPSRLSSSSYVIKLACDRPSSHRAA